MNTKHTHSDLERLADGECLPDEARLIQADLEADPKATEELRQLEELNQLVRSAAGSIEAPATLRESTKRLTADDNAADATSTTGNKLFGRRVLLAGAGGLLAAGLASVAVIPHIEMLYRRELDPVTTFFHDFETYLLKDKALDIAETNMVHLAGWYSDRLPFALPPIGSIGAGAELLGGRLCWLMERRLAALSYETNEGPFVFYVMDADGIELPESQKKSDFSEPVSWHRSSGHTSLIWKSGGLLIVMVGTQELRQLMSMAGVLVG